MTSVAPAWAVAAACLLAPLVLAGCVSHAAPVAAVDEDSLAARVTAEADFILSLQHHAPGDAADGAFNDVPGAPTWVVPRENGVAILGLLRAAAFVGGADAARYRDAAERAADYLVRVQRADGAWADQYAFAEPVTRAASPTQAAEVVIALAALPPSPARDAAIRAGAEWLLAAQAPANKTGPHADDGLVNGGTGEDGAWHREWRWASDNAFAYRAFQAAAARTGDARFADAAARVLHGLRALEHPDEPRWHRRVDGAHRPAAEPADWIAYAPAFLGLPGALDDPRLPVWIDDALGRGNGAVAWQSPEGAHAERHSPGFSFQACAVWNAMGHAARCREALEWADAAGLGGPGDGWVDWVDAERGVTAPAWQRFVDTSAYAIAAHLGERPFDAPGRVPGSGESR